MPSRYEVKLATALRLYHVVEGRSLICKIQVLNNEITGVFIDGELSDGVHAAIYRWATKKGYRVPPKIEVLGGITNELSWRSTH